DPADDSTNKHSKGMRVVADMVFSSTCHPSFWKLDSNSEIRIPDLGNLLLPRAVVAVYLARMLPLGARIVNFQQANSRHFAMKNREPAGRDGRQIAIGQGIQRSI